MSVKLDFSILDEVQLTEQIRVTYKRKASDVKLDFSIFNRIDVEIMPVMESISEDELKEFLEKCLTTP